MITEDYVSFETAKLLKEKGFKTWCYKSYGTAVYHKGVPISFDEECELKDKGLENEIEYVEGGYLYDFGYDNKKEDAKVYASPTLQMAMKWLRELHNLHCDIGYHFRLGWHIKIISLKETIIDHDIEMKTYLPYYLPYKSCDYLSYEEACENAIKYCLKELI